MLSMNRTRAPLLAAALVLTALLSACADAPTALISAADQAPALNTAPTVTVTNSGGNPLISWSALSGATGYTVQYQENRTIIVKATFESRSEQSVSTLATTTSTSHLDTSHAYTGKSFCSSSGTFETRITNYRYVVTAHYATGDASTSVAAPVSPC
ncbi:hypothetical protein [Longimicrobium sp.]|uniref:hypothetical protein n=1 Tax=Longimicrobium sp. TaxID=2029185 RepID=UPI002E3477A6|nr:hypothetical protein [Longimicrobium sp.]HEX6040300.1 hypothetical protein [Longimicrobium sp.]